MHSSLLEFSRDILSKSRLLSHYMLWRAQDRRCHNVRVSFISERVSL